MKIVCLGDSFTKGFGVESDKSWFRLLSANSTHTFVNKAINGDTTSGMLARFYTDVVAEQPTYVLIAGGANDFICSAEVSSVQSNIMAIVHQAYENNIIPIIGIEPPCEPQLVRDDWAAFSDFNTVAYKLEVFHQWLLRFCNTFHVNYIDFYSEFSNIIKDASKSDYYIDGLHLTVSGHKIIADIAQKDLPL